MACPWDGIPFCDTPSVAASPTPTVSSARASMTGGAGTVSSQTAHGSSSTVSGGVAPSLGCAHDGYDGTMTSQLGTDDGYDRYDGLVECSPTEISSPCEGAPAGHRGARGL